MTACRGLDSNPHGAFAPEDFLWIQTRRALQPRTQGSEAGYLVDIDRFCEALYFRRSQGPERGYTKFVGRQREMEALKHAATLHILRTSRAASRTDRNAKGRIKALGFNDCLNPFLSNGLNKRSVVPLVLIRILDGKLAHRVLKGVG